ncbi:TIGR02530 family flagellar biosynthesis protein [Cytobacillus sp. Hm23]
MTQRIFQPHPQYIQPRSNKATTGGHSSHANFKMQLASALETTDALKISKHAKQRLEQRGISIEPSQLQQMTAKVNEAKKMGVQDSLVLFNHAAFIVSAKNNTIVTAMDRTEASSQIFTNINGTIIMD